jgi:hypothetical protein
VIGAAARGSGTCRCGIGVVRNSRRVTSPIQRAHRVHRATRALSVATPCVGVHLPIEPGRQHEREPGFERRDDARAFPDVAPAVKPIPGVLRAASNVLQRHEGVWRIELRPLVLRNQPMSGDRNTLHLPLTVAFLGLPLLEVDGARKRREQHELREGEVRPLRQRHRGVEAVRVVARQAEDEGTQDVNVGFGHPRTVCTDPHMYRPSGSRSHRAGAKCSASTRPPS